MTEEKLGPTGEYPKGKLNEEDEGQLRLAVGITEDNKIMMDFGTPVSWIGLDVDDAISIGNALINHALQIRNGKKGG